MNRETHFLLFEGPFWGPKTLAWQLVPTGFHPFDILLGGKVILFQALGCMCVHVSVNRASIIVWNYRVVHDCMYVCVHTWVWVCTCAYAYKYTCVRVCPGLTSGLWFSDLSSHSMRVSGPSWSEATGSLFVRGQVSSGIHLFLKSVFLNIVFLNWILFCMCQGHSSFKEGPWRILCNEFEFEFSYIRFSYKMAKCAPGVPSSIGHFSMAGRLILPQCHSRATRSWRQVKYRCQGRFCL